MKSKFFNFSSLFTQRKREDYSDQKHTGAPRFSIRGFLKKMTLVLLPVEFMAGNVIAQEGYLNFHLKNLSEEGSGSSVHSFSITGPGGYSSTFAVNDAPNQQKLRDIGTSKSGRLYAVTDGGELYYRDPITSSWANTAITAISRVDGGAGNEAWLVTESGNVLKFSGVFGSSPTTYYTYISGTNWKAVDVTFALNSTTDNGAFVLRENGKVWRYYVSLPGWQEHLFSGITGTPKNIDAALGGTVFAATNNRVYASYTSGTVTDYGSPSSDIQDIAVASTDNVYISGPNLQGVKKFQSGTTWSAYEPESYGVDRITGGAGFQIWGLYLRNMTSEAGVGNIVSRAYNGGTGEVYWVDDERVRSTIFSFYGNTRFLPLTPGVYTITLSSVAGSFTWETQKITIYNPTSTANTTNILTKTATVTIQAGGSTNIVWQSGRVNPFAMTTNCTHKYTEDFGTGAIGSFGEAVRGQTSYHYNGTSPAIHDGQYRLITRGSDFGTYATSLAADHTTDEGGATGYMYAVNSSFDKGEFFRRRFNGLVVGARYKFAAWIASTSNATIKPNVSFKVYDGITKNLLQSNNTGDINTAFVWNQYHLEFVATSTELDLVLDNNNVGGEGNDLVLDDITFELVPPPGPMTFNIAPANCSGTTGTIEVTAPLSPQIEYALDESTTYQTSPIFSGVSIAPHTVRARYITTTGCELSNVVIMTVSACGNIFNDANGLTDNLVNGTGIGTASGAPLYMNLYNTTGGFVSSTPVNATGTYTLQGLVPGTQYTSTVSSVMGTTGSTLPTTPILPTGWVSTGEKNGTGTGGDGLVDGKLTFTIPSASMNNVNFGIEQRPTAGSGSNTIVNIPGTSQITVPANTFTNTANSTDSNPGVVSSIIITAIPIGVTTIVIDGTTYGSGFTTFPSGGVNISATSMGQPTVTITVDPTLEGVTTVSIPYVAVDNGGITSSNTGIATINFVAHPDLTPIILLPINNFDIGTEREFIVQLSEVMNTSTTAPIAFNITVPPGYLITFDGAQTHAVVASSGTHTISNSEWNVVSSTASTFDFQSKAGFSIDGTSNTKLGFKITRTSAVFTNSSAVIIVNIYPDAEEGYDSNNANNVYSRIVTAY